MATNVFRHKINLDSTTAFGEKNYKLSLDLAGRQWVRLEVWDVPQPTVHLPKLFT
jgi:hypothetical protein